MYKLTFMVLSAIAAASGNPALLFATDSGVEVRSSNGQQNESFTVLPFSTGVRDVDYHLERGEIYAILNKNGDIPLRIVRVKIAKENQQLADIPEWCNSESNCEKIRHISNITYIKLKPNKCWEANNLVVDWLHDKIYWNCDGNPSTNDRSKIVTANLSSSERQFVVDSSGQIQSFDIDHYDETLFVLSRSNYSFTLDKFDLKKKIPGNPYQFNEGQTEVISKISLDTQKKIIYVVGYSRSNEEIFLGSLDYDGSNFRKHFKSKDPAWRTGPRIMNSVVYWLSQETSEHQWDPFDNSSSGEIEMNTSVGPNKVNQWRILHLDAQTIDKDTPCRRFGCSHNCSLSHWIQITCECPSTMRLDSNNKTCFNTSVIPEEKALQVTTNAPAVNSSAGLTDDADEESSAVMTSSTWRYTLVCIVVVAVWSLIILFVVVVVRRGNRGNYQPNSEDRCDMSTLQHATRSRNINSFSY